MNWYRENRWLGNFLLAFAATLLLGIWFLFHAKGAFADALAEFNTAATERSRLEHLNPFPNEENFRKTQAALENYGASLNKQKEELRAQVLPAAPLAPNEFQTRLRQAIGNTAEKARANHVKLPENFYLGFDELVAALPANKDAQLLGQELQQIELLTGILIDAKVDGIATLKRKNLSPEAAAAATPAPKNAPAVVERGTVDLTFASSPSVLRKVLNQIASSERQFFIVRTLYVRNEQSKGPSREQSTPAAASSPNALKFIVGNEHVEATAAIELVRVAF
jgi:hypothetical protein